jgi:hypothetical protein
MRTLRNPLGQLGSTSVWPFSLRSIGRQFRDALSDRCRSSFAFPGLRRFHIRSCHARPGRRGHIQRVTAGIGFFGLLNAASFCPALRLGRPQPRDPSAQRFHVLQSTPDGFRSALYTGSPVSSRRATFYNPDSTACRFGLSLEQPRMARLLFTVLASVQLV